MREKYRWAAAVPGRPEQAKCSLDGKLISVRNGAIQLGQHEKQKIHIDAAAALPRQPSIRNSLVSAVDDDSGRLRATFYHVVRIALDGGSFRSSDCVPKAFFVFGDVSRFPFCQNLLWANQGAIFACSRTGTIRPFRGH